MIYIYIYNMSMIWVYTCTAEGIRKMFQVPNVFFFPRHFLAPSLSWHSSQPSAHRPRVWPSSHSLTCPRWPQELCQLCYTNCYTSPIQYNTSPNCADTGLLAHSPSVFHFALGCMAAFGAKIHQLSRDDLEVAPCFGRPKMTCTGFDDEGQSEAYDQTQVEISALFRSDFFCHGMVPPRNSNRLVTSTRRGVFMSVSFSSESSAVLSTCIQTY